MYGGFVSGAQLFDADAFNISRAEAGNMDPQHRLLLEQGYASLADAGLTRKELDNSSTAVLVGIQMNEVGPARIELWRNPPSLLTDCF